MVTLSNIKNFNVDNVHVVKTMCGDLGSGMVMRVTVFSRELEGAH